MRIELYESLSSAGQLYPIEWIPGLIKISQSDAGVGELKFPLFSFLSRPYTWQYNPE